MSLTFRSTVDGIRIVGAIDNGETAAAAASALAAAASASTAATQAGVATTQAGIATTQAGIATTQASTATTQAGIAATQATNAAGSASNAATSATAAGVHATNAAASATALASNNLSSTFRWSFVGDATSFDDPNRPLEAYEFGASGPAISRTVLGDAGSAPAGLPIVVWGNSLSTLTYAWINRMATVLGRTVISRGVSGQTATQIAARQGGLPILLTSGVSIPGAVSPVVIPCNINILQDGGVFTGSAACSINGIAGTMTVDGSGVLSFTRTEVGLTTSVSSGAQVVLDDAVALRNNPCIFWFGRNPNPTSNANVQATLAALRGATAYHADPLKRHLIFPTTPRTTETASTTNPTLIAQRGFVLAENDQMRFAYPDKYVDVRNYLIRQAPYDVGTPTSTDLSEMADDIIPASLLIDTVHFGTPLGNALGDYVAAVWRARGW